MLPTQEGNLRHLARSDIASHSGLIGERAGGLLREGPSYLDVAGHSDTSVIV